MPAQKIGLYIGKFQPFHNGHLFAIKDILPKVSQLIIVIGSSQYHDLPDQPFSAEQRRQMIERTLGSESIDSFSIAEVPDIHDPEHWVEHVCRHIPRFDIVFTNNESVGQLFTKKEFKVESIKALPAVSGTAVRQKLAAADSSWQSLVPPAAAAILRTKIQREVQRRA
jgi:nicotinamide-nucleotide adenylyltransferase